MQEEASDFEEKACSFAREDASEPTAEAYDHGKEEAEEPLDSEKNDCYFVLQEEEACDSGAKDVYCCELQREAEC